MRPWLLMAFEHLIMGAAMHLGEHLIDEAMKPRKKRRLRRVSSGNPPCRRVSRRTIRRNQGQRRDSNPANVPTTRQLTP